jgi:hypothetical protein
MRSLKYFLIAAVLAGAACSDSSSSKSDAALVSSDGGGTNPDGGASNPDGAGSNPDGGGVTPDGGTAQKTLAEFVIDLVKNRTNETGTPESLDDKTLTDTSDPAAFLPLF